MITEKNNKNVGIKNNKLVRQLGADKKKTVTAICLVLLMFFMWVKALSKDETNTASAATLNKAKAAQQADKEVKLSFVELPNIEGRNDSLTRDFFSVDNWGNLNRGSSSGVKIFSQNDKEDSVKHIILKLKLEAIDIGEKPRAFINERLLGIGDTFLINDKDESYKCEVIEIEENKVFLKYEDIEIELKFAQEAK